MYRGSGANRIKGAGGLAALALAIVFTVGGCKSSEPTASPTPSVGTKSPPSATASDDAWRQDFSGEELAAYQEALDRYSAYSSAVRPVWASGKATASAKRVFMDYFVPWKFFYDQLKQYETSGIRLDVQDRVLTSRATRVKLGSDGSSVSIRQCVDQTKSSGTQEGTPLSKSSTTPQFVDVTLSQSSNKWLITSISNSSKDRPCAR